MKIKLYLSTILLSILVLSSVSAKAFEPHSATDHDKGAESLYQTTAPILDLSEAVKIAINVSPQLQSANAELSASQASEDQAGYWQNPEFSFEAENVLGSGLYSGSSAGEYNYGVNQTFEVGGKISARKNAAAAFSKIRQSQLHSQRLDVKEEVHLAYVAVLGEAEDVKISHEQEQVAKDVLNTVSKRVEKAAEPEIQLSKAEVAYSTGLITRQQEERQLHVAKKKLERLLGVSILNRPLDHAYFYQLEAPKPVAEYLEQLADTPDIQRLQYVKEEKLSQLDLEKAEAIPDPNVNIGVRDFRESGDQALLFGVSIPVPILNQNQGNISKARAELSQSESDARLVVLKREQEITENWQAWNGAYLEAEQFRKTLIPSAVRAFNLARDGYEKGKFPYLEVLDALRTLFDARAQYHDALKLYHISRAKIERLTTHIGE